MHKQKNLYLLILKIVTVVTFLASLSFALDQSKISTTTPKAVSISKWKNTDTPYGGPILNVVSNSENPNVLITAVTNAGGYLQLYRSTDAGQHWTPIKSKANCPKPNSDSNECNFHSPQSLIVTNKDNFYLADGLVYKSNDDGKTWVQLGNNQLLTGESMESSDGAIYLWGGNDGAIKVSYDAGAHWQSLGTQYALNMSALGADGQTIYFATQVQINNGQANLFKSENGGRSFSVIKSFHLGGVIGKGITGILVQGNLVIVTTKTNFIFKSTDGGQHWEHITKGLGKKIMFNSIQAFGNRIFLATNKGIYVSNDKGASWYVVYDPVKNKYFDVSNIFPHDGNTLYASTSRLGIMKSSDGGKTWRFINNGLIAPSITAMIDHGSQIIVGTNYGGIYIKTNLNTNWRQIKSRPKPLLPLGHNRIFALLYNDNTLLVGGATIHGVNSDGETWFLAKGNLGYITTLLKYNSFLFSGDELGVHISQDNGHTWSRISFTPLSVKNLVATTSGLYLNTMNSVYKGYSGENWSKVGGDVYGGINQFFGHKNVLYMVTRWPKIQVSNDGGLHWKNTGINLNSQVKPTNFSSSNDRVFVYANGLYMSADNGKTWQKIGDKISAGKAKVLLVHGNTVFVGTNTHGIYQAKINPS